MSWGSRQRRGNTANHAVKIRINNRVQSRRELQSAASRNATNGRTNLWVVEASPCKMLRMSGVKAVISSTKVELKSASLVIVFVRKKPKMIWNITSEDH